MDAEKESLSLQDQIQQSFQQSLDTTPLLEEYVESGKSGELLELRVDGYDVYNITSPAQIGTDTFIFGRVEKRESEEDSRICAFKKVENAWIAIELDLPPLQDPAIAIIQGKVVLSGIKVSWETLTDGSRAATNYWTEFFILDEGLKSTWLSRGPDRMKDIRLFQMNDQVGCFTRPYEMHRQGAGGGKVGFIRFSDLENIHAQEILDAPLIDIELPPDEWMGANFGTVVDGLVWVLGHVGRWVGTEPYRIREYDAVIFVFDPETNKCSKVVTVAKNSEFRCHKQKNPHLRRIVFSGGFEINEDGSLMTIYVGLNDVAAASIQKKNIFPELARSLVHPVIPEH